jgi:hypothetical protein
MLREASSKPPAQPPSPAPNVIRHGGYSLMYKENLLRMKKQLVIARNMLRDAG